MYLLALSLYPEQWLRHFRDTFAVGWIDIVDLIVRAVIVYVVLLIGIRLTGKREVGQMTPFDLVLLLLISNAVQNAMIGPYNGLTAGLIAAMTLLIVNMGLSRMVFRSKKWRRRIEGSATLLIYDGVLNKDGLRREGVTEEELKAALREHGIEKFQQVHLAVLEVDGNISVIQLDEKPQTHRPHHRFRFLQRKN
ncbi:MAG: DUF421 domain-containing protein [Acidobacteriia bacterium]|nr:DUF421 domain-containing protein [Terriglobia bacterium]